MISVVQSENRALGWTNRLFFKTGSFEKAVKKELPVLYRVARRMGCSAEEAEDVVQNALIKAYQAWDRFDGGHLRSWLIKILRNERLMLLRHTHNDSPLDENEGYESTEQPFWEEVAWKMHAGRILEELENIPEAYRLTIHLCDIEQMSYEEAAESMDVPVGTVRSRLFRARAMLRKRLVELNPNLEEAHF